MQIAIIGAGAMGSLFACRLIDAGAEVTLIDVDKALLQVLSSSGLKLHDQHGQRTYWPQVATCDEVHAVMDVLIVFTKSYHTRQAITSCLHLVSASTLVVTLQNGLDSLPVLREYIPDDQLAMGMTLYPADVVSPGVVRSLGEAQVRMRGVGVAPARGLDKLVEQLCRGGLQSLIDPHIDVTIWEKVVFNTALNSVCALTGATVGEVALHRDHRRQVFALVREAVSVAWAVGVAVNVQRIQAGIEEAFVVHATHKPSMLQDVEHGRRIEVDALSGALLGHAARHALEVPALASVDALLRRIGRGVQARQDTVQPQRNGENAAGR
ncbi:ketopantoate reductase family protein [Pseudomonas sp. NPDC090592]|uniref:ketopantoate reductase family protein n=1 Tax=Pseudomonas sp. NPDC090592 TaxID=3364480 RepID=UPI00383A1205